MGRVAGSNGRDSAGYGPPDVAPAECIVSNPASDNDPQHVTTVIKQRDRRINPARNRLEVPPRDVTVPITSKRSAARVSKIVRDVFGLAELRPGQQAVIDSVLAKRHTLAIMPTGAGNRCATRCLRC